MILLREQFYVERRRGKRNEFWDSLIFMGLIKEESLVKEIEKISLKGKRKIKGV